MTRAGLGSVREDVTLEDDEPQVMRPTTTSASTGEASGFFEHELRGYCRICDGLPSNSCLEVMTEITSSRTGCARIAMCGKPLF